MQISEPVQSHRQKFALFALGFRPFFLFAGLSAFSLMAYWLLLLSDVVVQDGFISPVYWHSHEMIFGYTTAAIAGFLLTAVRNWTGVSTLTGWMLTGLFVLWLLPRLLYFIEINPLWLALIDLAFLPLLAIAIACPMLKARQWNNLFFVGLILLLGLAHALFYAPVLSIVEATERWGLRSALGIVLIIITVMAGRVVGFFIERGLNQKVKNINWINQLALWATIGFVATQFILPVYLLSLILIFAIAGHAGRLFIWYHADIWKQPLLWVLYLGYAWMPVGFILSLLSLNGLIAETLAIHSFTVGTIGVMTLGMMARVALGHTGRTMQSSAPVNIAFVLINIAVVMRVLLPAFLPDFSAYWMQIAGISWILAFVLFSWVYLPVLIKSRIDGRAG